MGTSARTTFWERRSLAAQHFHYGPAGSQWLIHASPHLSVTQNDVIIKRNGKSGLTMLDYPLPSVEISRHYMNMNVTSVLDTHRYMDYSVLGLLEYTSLAGMTCSHLVPLQYTQCSWISRGTKLSIA
jgi:hypothetical protein